MEDADWAEEEPADEDYFRLGEQDEQFHDYADLPLKEDHPNRCSCRASFVLHFCEVLSPETMRAAPHGE